MSLTPFIVTVVKKLELRDVSEIPGLMRSTHVPEPFPVLCGLYEFPSVGVSFPISHSVGLACTSERSEPIITFMGEKRSRRRA